MPVSVVDAIADDFATRAEADNYAPGYKAACGDLSRILKNELANCRIAEKYRPTAKADAPEPEPLTVADKAAWVEYKLGYLYDGAETETARGSWIIALLKGNFDNHIRAWLAQQQEDNDEQA